MIADFDVLPAAQQALTRGVKLKVTRDDLHDLLIGAALAPVLYLIVVLGACIW